MNNTVLLQLDRNLFNEILKLEEDVLVTGDKDLGSSSYDWKNLYMSGNIIKGSYTLTLPSKTGTVALTSDIKKNNEQNLILIKSISLNYEYYSRGEKMKLAVFDFDSTFGGEVIW